MVQAGATENTYRILRNKPPNLRIVIPKSIVVQPRLVVEILPLKPQVLLDLVHLELFNRAPRLIRRLPDNLPLPVRHLQRRTDLVGMEVIERLRPTLRLIHPR